MRRTAFKSLVLAAALPGLVGNGPARPGDVAPHGADRTGEAQFVSESSLGFATCAAGAPEPKTVVRIAIPKNFSTTDRKRHVRHRSTRQPETGDDEALFDNSAPNAGATPDFQTNPFHMEIGSIKGPEVDPAYVKVKVILRNKAYKFYEDASRTPAILGVVYEQGKPGADLFCQKGRADAFTRSRNGKKNVLTFYVLRQKEFPSASINLIVVADCEKPTDTTGGCDTPILIDPKIRNNG